MGFFKSVGNKLKRVVSIKNVVNAVTGQYSAIGKDVVRVMKSEDPKRKSLQSVNSLTSKSYALPPTAVQLLEQQEQTFKDNLANSVSDIPAVQKASDFFSKVYLQSMWKKHKNWIIGFISVLTAFLLWRFVFSKKQNGRKRR